MTGSLVRMAALMDDVPVDEALVETAARAGAALPSAMREALARFTADPGPDGVLLLRALSAGDVASTSLPHPDVSTYESSGRST